MRPRLTVANAAVSTVLAAMLAACQSAAPAANPNRAALPTMERVALGANACWFKSGDPAFAAYKLAPELNSFTGRPRILLVHKGSPESRPLLVVQAEGSPARLQAFGPMMQEPVAGRIAGDVNRWSSGNKACN
ncbi:hypothetical protein ATY78_11535 [Rhizobium sp. R635]|uniref:hypothetical protein n=1 Tax=unclassified Rhizobium TaxID=2613769 RepID=UPI000B531665|nr:hypothetical protein [Rhizobium sp. R635]OWV78731.1 hypothetical protein ATY78_11535 [Rhizobium sp. R635]